jgi:hypothetical protein
MEAKDATLAMSDRLLTAIKEACDAIRSLPVTNASLQDFRARNIERGKYDATLPIREKLADVLAFLEPFDRCEFIKEFSELPRPLFDSIATELEALKAVAEEIPSRCLEQTTSVVPPGFHGAETGVARGVETAFSRIYPNLAPLRLRLLQSSSARRDRSAPVAENATVNVVGGSSGTACTEQQVVISLHGIRTTAKWQKPLAERLAKAGFIPKALDYGWFSVFLFLFKRQRDKKVEWFVDEYRAIRSEYPGCVPSVVAHSLGTYIVARAISESAGAVTFDKVLFCGSIVPIRFPWSRVIAAKLVNEVFNDCGQLDFWAARVGLALPDAEASGKLGFNDLADGKVQQHIHPAWDHSRFFFPLNYDERWIKFLKGMPVPVNLSLPSAHHFPLLWILVCAFVLAGTATGAKLLYDRWNGAPKATPSKNSVIDATSSVGEKTLQRRTLTLEVIAESRGKGSDVSTTRQRDIPKGWTFVKMEEQVQRGKHGSEGDGKHEPPELVYDDAGRIIAVRATATALRNYGSKTNYYKLVLTIFVERRGQ